MHELLEKRRSIRKYKKDSPVTQEQLKQLLGAAMIAPSARNSRPWEFIAITKRELLDKIVTIHPNAKMLESASAAIIIVAVPPADMPAAFFPQDCGAATQNILLEAAAMGLGTCWCGVYPIEERMDSLRELLGVAKEKLPFCVIAVGSPDEAPDQRGFFDEARVTYLS